MTRRASILAGLGLIGFAIPPAAAQPEWTQVVGEACGADPQVRCLIELRKVCHEHPSFRCYYSRKARFDAVRQVGFPDDRPRMDD